MGSLNSSKEARNAGIPSAFLPVHATNDTATNKNPATSSNIRGRRCQTPCCSTKRLHTAGCHARCTEGALRLKQPPARNTAEMERIASAQGCCVAQKVPAVPASHALHPSSAQKVPRPTTPRTVAIQVAELGRMCSTVAVPQAGKKIFCCAESS